MRDGAVPADGGSVSALVERLAGELRPVRRRRLARDAAALCGFALLELALFLLLGLGRPDMTAAMATPSLWWKGASTLALATIGGATALMSLDPARSARPGLRTVGLVLALVFGVGWLLDALAAHGASLSQRLDPLHGMRCAVAMALLALPPALALGLLARRGAPTDPDATGLASGLAAAGWGAFVFAFGCPDDDPLYLALWYAVGCAAVVLTVRLALPRLIRW